MIIPVHSEYSDYDIILENGALGHIGEICDLNRNVLVVTDDGVPFEYSEAVIKSSKNPVSVVLPHGEKTKNIDSLQVLLKAMLDAGFSRGDCVVAVGGGVIGDLSGFAASLYMRGIDFYNIPTTLLSEVDSSIGGKTAIDFGGVKNSVGSFYQPKKVIIDPETLKTLDSRQVNAGLAESIKMALTSDAELFSLIENSSDISYDLPEIIRHSLMIKKGVVERDPHEKGERRVLNFGHTVGHAIESLADGTLLHGECVAVGLIPMCSPQLCDRITKVLIKYSLPYSTEFSSGEMLPLIMHDKKKSGDSITAVLVDTIGTYRFSPLTKDMIAERIDSSGITGEKA